MDEVDSPLTDYTLLSGRRTIETICVFLYIFWALSWYYLLIKVKTKKSISMNQLEYVIPIFNNQNSSIIPD
jgi:hypothetical protein